LIGPSGCGKTRLLQALLLEWSDRDASACVTALSGEEFVSRCLDANAQEKGWISLREELRNASLLVIDDVQAIERSPSALAELEHTLDRLINTGAAVVLTAKVPPAFWNASKRLGVWSNRLISLVAGGVLARIEPPGTVLRRRFVLEQLRNRDLALSTEAIDWLAASAAGFRELEGWVTHLSFWARKNAPSAAGRPLDANQVKALLEETIPFEAATSPALDILVRSVAKHFDLPVRDLIGPSRLRSLVVPRHLAILVAHEHTGASYASLARYFGNRDPKTIRHACLMARRRLVNDPSLDSSLKLAVESARPRILKRSDQPST
jgi:chromosomal replication initiator protein